MNDTHRNLEVRNETMTFKTDEGKIVPFGINVYTHVQVGDVVKAVNEVEPSATFMIETWKSKAKFFVTDEFMTKSIVTYDISTIKGVR